MARTARSWKFDAALVGLYLGAIVSANLLVAKYGQVALPFTAFVLIPFDLVTRDILHERWYGRALWTRMTLLIASGSILAALLNVEATRVAIASFLAFACANITNAGVFHILYGKVSRWLRMNTSNFFAAAVDSVVFPVAAFAVVNPWLCVAQWLSKFAGGLVFSSLFVWWDERKR